MTFFDKPRALPGIALIMYRYLASRGPTHRESLLSAIAPPMSPYTGSYGNALDETLDTVIPLGLIQKNQDDTLSVPDDLAHKVAKSVPSFSHHVRRLLFTTLDDSGPAPPASDLNRALAWFLGQDPLRPFFPWGSNQGAPEPEALQNEQLGFANRVVTNDAQWGSFVRWATFLGFAERLRWSRLSLLIPDPTKAVGATIASLPGHHLPADLLRDLALAIPVLDGGAVRTDIETSLGRNQSTVVSGSLSCALLRLAESRALQFANPADAPEHERLVLTVGRDTLTVASIAIEQAA